MPAAGGGEPQAVVASLAKDLERFRGKVLQGLMAVEVVRVSGATAAAWDCV